MLYTQFQKCGTAQNTEPPKGFSNASRLNHEKTY